MKRTIKRTEITIESLEITTIRTTPSISSQEVPSENGGGTLPDISHPDDRLATRVERAKQLLRRKKR